MFERQGHLVPRRKRMAERVGNKCRRFDRAVHLTKKHDRPRRDHRGKPLDRPAGSCCGRGRGNPQKEKKEGRLAHVFSWPKLGTAPQILAQNRRFELYPIRS